MTAIALASLELALEPREESLAMTQAEMLKLIAEQDHEQSEAHKRHGTAIGKLGEHVRELEDEVHTNAGKIAALDKKVALMEERPVDAMKLVMTPKIVIILVGFAVSIVGGVYASTANLKQNDADLRAAIVKNDSDMRAAIANIITKMDAQHEVSDANARINQAALAEQAKALDEVKRQQALQGYEIQTLKDLVQGRRPK